MRLTLFLTNLLLLFFITGCDNNGKKQFQGYIEGENIYLASPYSGTLKKLYVKRGEQVKSGQLLFQLDEEPQSLIIKQAQGELLQAQNTLSDLEKPKRTPEIEAIKAQIEQTKSQIELAAIRVSRYTQLYAKNAVDKDSLDAAEANYKQLVQLKSQYESNLELARLGSRDEQIKAQAAQVLALNAKLNEAQWELMQKRIVAPTSGIIYDTYFRVGEFVGTQQSVLSLLSPENTFIEFFIPAEGLIELKLGEKITFICYGCTDSSTAFISYISPEAEYIPPLVYSRENNQKLVFRIKARMEKGTPFKPGQPVSVFLP